MGERNESLAAPSDIQLAMEKNLAEHAFHLHRQLTTASVKETDDLVIADSGLEDDTFNIVAAARFTPATAAKRVAETVQSLATTARPFSWWVGPTSTPAHLSQSLAASRLEPSEPEPASCNAFRGSL